MPSESTQFYFARRREECLAKARNVADPSIARIHRDFAAQYERALQGMGGPANDLVARRMG